MNENAPTTFIGDITNYTARENNRDMSGNIDKLSMACDCFIAFSHVVAAKGYKEAQNNTINRACNRQSVNSYVF